MVVRLAADPAGSILAAGLDDGRVWSCDLKTQALAMLKAKRGPPISALAIDVSNVAWGDEEGAAGVADLPAL